MKRYFLLSITLLLTINFAQEGARYLIITTDALAPVIQPLAEWKHVSGLKCKVTKLSEIGSDTASIKNYIRNAYNNWPIRPEYVLLVGSPNNLPARRHTVQGQGTFYSDNIYGDINSDIYMDIPVGRFPAKSARQCSVMVAKTLAYERYPDLTDTIWMRRITTVIRESDYQPDPDDTIYWNDARIAAGNFPFWDSLSRLQGHTAADVVNSVTRGAAILLYRGTAVENWYEPFAVNPALTNNGKKLPIILSITCETMTLAPNDSMVGDAWIKTGTPTNLKGAVAFFGNTHSLYSGTTTVRKRSAVTRAFFKAVFQEGKTRLGWAMIRGKDSLYRAFGDAADYRGFNLLGDPSLDIWTDIPRLPEVNHPAEIAPGEQELAVAVSLDSMPFPNALVCISMDTTIYQYNYTDSNGLVVFHINPPDTGRLRLVVTGHNLYPYDTLIPITLSAVAENPTLPAKAKIIALPKIFNNYTRIIWEPTGNPSLTIFDATGRAVRRFSNITTDIIWDGTDNNHRKCPAGVYYACLDLPDRADRLVINLLKLK